MTSKQSFATQDEICTYEDCLKEIPKGEILFLNEYDSPFCSEECIGNLDYEINKDFNKQLDL